MSGMSGWLFTIEIGDTVYIDAVNDYTTFLGIKKVDSDKAPLEGAVFTLEASSDNGKTYTVVDIGTTDANGTVMFDDLDRYMLYRVTETKAPEGYSLLASPVYTGPATGEEVVVTVGNNHIVMLPMTGGNGMWTVSLGAALLIIMGSCMRRKKTSLAHK